MFNIDFIYEFENQFLKFKISLRKLIRSVIRKGMSRMYKIDFFDFNCKDLISEILKSNLTDQQYMLLRDLLENFQIEMEKLVQRFINEEVEGFLKENPHASKKGEITVERKTVLGTLCLKVPRFRNAEFKSVIIQKKTRNFFTETMLLAMIAMNGLMSYEQTKTFFKLRGVNITNNEIARITKIVNKYRDYEFQSQELELNPHQHVVFVDGVWVKHKYKDYDIHWLTGECISTIKVKKCVKITAIGIDVEGNKKVLTSIISDSEDSEGYSQLLNKLKNEIGIQKIDVMVSDGSPALNDPLLEYYPETKRQRCVAHVMRSLKLLMCKRDRKEIIPLIKKIYRQESKQDAINYWNSIYDTLVKLNSRVAKQLKKIIETTLTFYDLPKPLWKASYTNNISENLNSVFRRFSPSNTCFYNLDSVHMTWNLTALHLNSIYKKYDLS